jgi:hypothetical protein
MKTLLRLMLYSLAALLLSCVVLVFFAVGNTPDIALKWSLTPADIGRAKKILHEGSKSKPDEINTLELSRADLNLAANYLLNRYSKSAVFIGIKENKLKFVVTATLPENRLGKYLNVTFRLGNEGDSNLPSLTKFKAGKLLLPSKLAAFVINQIIQHTSLKDYFILATHPIEAVRIDADKIVITYHSNRETLVKARDLLTHGTENTALNPYQQQLLDVVAHHDPNWRLSLAELLKPLFALAYQRSSLETAIAENKQVIFTINDYVNKEGGRALPKHVLDTTTIRQTSTFLYKRIDLAQHFIASAAITASANGQLAQMMGEEKELSDAKGGSGFSFIDLTADKAGTRFGEVATASADSARKLQKTMSEIHDYRDFMPDPTHFAEHMNETEFKRRYGSTSSSTYLQVVKDIESRIAGLPIYKPHQSLVR